MRSDKERDMLERQFQKMELNSLSDLYPHQIEIVPNHNPELAGKITEDARKILKLTMSHEYGDLSKLDKNKMYGQSGTIILDDPWYHPFAKLFDTYCMNDVLLTVPLIPNRFDLKERAKANPKFNCRPSDKAHTSNPTKRKASRLARKARRNNR